MKHFIGLLAFVAVMLPLSSFGQGITNTRHDMAVASATPGPRAQTETQTCVFCHTPHRSLAQELIWNHNLAVGTRGWAAGQLTAEGTTLPPAITADSMRCLSCHDGTVGLGNVNNAGGGVPGSITMTGPVSAGYLVGNGAPGNEMLNNHPVSIPYAGETANGITSGAIADNGIGNYYTVASGPITCQSPSGFCTSAPLTGAFVNLKGTALGQLAVECSSCHEPHNKYAGLYFLRVSAAQSQLCRACHNK